MYLGPCETTVIRWFGNWGMLIVFIPCSYQRNIGFWTGPDGVGG